MTSKIADQSVVATAREAFLNSGEESADVRPATLRAWRRSLAAGAKSDAEPTVVISSSIDPESALLRAVEPVATGMMDHLGTADFAMMAMDRDAHVAGRWVSDRSLSRQLDTMGVVVGAWFDESLVGSTGLGTVLEDRTTAIVDGAEHFNRRFDAVIAVGAPIIYPGTGCVEGVLDLVCPTGVRPEIMVALIERAAREVGERLLSGFAAQDRALLDAFLQLERRGPRRPVVAINRRMVMANSSANGILGARPHAALWRSVHETLCAGETSLVLTGDSGQSIRAQVRGVSGSDSAAGALLQLGPGSDASILGSRSEAQDIAAALHGQLAGRSPLWRSAVSAAAHAGASGGRLLVCGPAGVGKTALAETLIDCLNTRAATTESDRDHDSVLFDDIVVESRSDLSELRGRLQSCSSRVVIATIDAPTAADLDDRLLGEFEYVVELPDLSRRPEDVAGIAVSLLQRISGGRNSLTAEALQVLSARTWRGNAHQLQRVLIAAVTRAPGSRIRPVDLPTEPDPAPPAHRKLTYLENVEREAIAALLASTGGNKRQVADVLGVSRSTLYRKLAALHLI